MKFITPPVSTFLLLLLAALNAAALQMPSVKILAGKTVETSAAPAILTVTNSAANTTDATAVEASEAALIANGTIPNISVTEKVSWLLTLRNLTTTKPPGTGTEMKKEDSNDSKTTKTTDVSTVKPEVAASDIKTTTVMKNQVEVNAAAKIEAESKTVTKKIATTTKKPLLKGDKKLAHAEAAAAKVDGQKAAGNQQYAVVADHDLQTAAGGHGHGHKSGHKSVHYESGGHKGGKGYDNKNVHKSGHEAGFGEKGAKGFFDKGGKNHKGDHHTGGKHSHHKSGHKGGKGHKSGKESFHDSGFSKEGFKHEHHKEEEGISKKFWDHADHKGHHSDYDHLDSHFAKHKGGGFAKKSFKGHKAHDAHGKKGFFVKGKHHSDKSGHHGKHGHQSDHGHKSSFGKKGGHKSGHKSNH